MTIPAAVVVLAAGQGTRMKSDLPKVVHPVAGLSVLGRVLRVAQTLHPDRLITMVRHQRDVVAIEVMHVAPKTLIADQDEVPGTGRAVLRAFNAMVETHDPLEGTVVVTFGDVPMLSPHTLASLVALHEDEGHTVTVPTSTAKDPTGYGRIVHDEIGIVTAIVEQKDATEAQRLVTEVSAGVYAFDGAFLVKTLLRVGQDNAQSEAYLTDVLATATSASRTAGALVLNDSWEARGCNDRAQPTLLVAKLNQRICQARMCQGVTIVDPASTWIGVDVQIGHDTVIWPGSVPRGDTIIGSHCGIGPGTTPDCANVIDRARVVGSWVSRVNVAADMMVVPFSVIGQPNRD